MTDALLGMGDPAPYSIVEGPDSSPLVFVCDHASNRVPGALQGPHWNGLLDKHIGYDIGVDTITRHLAERFDAPAILGGYSRLVADLNRFPADPTFAPAVSDRVNIPANTLLSDADRQARVDEIFAPYHCSVEMQLDRQLAAGVAPVVFLIHSMTPQMDRQAPRTMDIDVMSMTDRRVADRLLEALRSNRTLTVTDNDPYELEASDYTAVVHCVRRDLPHVQIEFRQDLVGTRDAAIHWADILGDAIEQSAVRALASASTMGDQVGNG